MKMTAREKMEKRSRRFTERNCCVCGSPRNGLGILVLNRASVLSAFPQLRPRKRFPLCLACRRKVQWVEVES